MQTGRPQGVLRLAILWGNTNRWWQMQVLKFPMLKIYGWVNYGNVIIMNTLSAMKNPIIPFQNTLSIILQNGQVINFIQNKTLGNRADNPMATK